MIKSTSEAYRSETSSLAVPASSALGAFAPARWADFFELTKPRMNFLVVITTAVGFFMAVRFSFEWVLLLHTLLGTALTAAGASVLNQHAEREHDGRMQRTADRPLPGRRVAPLEALVFGMVLAVVGVIYLAATVNVLTAGLGLFTLLSYLFVYTPLKRRTTLCTIVGAVPGAIPPVMGWTAVQNELSPGALALFGILFLWQMPHFLAIGIMYRDDYARGGFKMLPVVDRELRVTGRQMVLYALTLIPMSLTPIGMQMSGPIYLVLALTLGLAFLFFACSAASEPTRPAARRLFIASILYLPLLMGGMMIDKL